MCRRLCYAISFAFAGTFAVAGVAEIDFVPIPKYPYLVLNFLSIREDGVSRIIFHLDHCSCSSPPALFYLAWALAQLTPPSGPPILGQSFSTVLDGLTCSELSWFINLHQFRGTLILSDKYSLVECSWHFQSLVLVSVADPDPRSEIRDPGSGAFFDPWIRDPGWVESQHPDPGSGMNNPNHIF